MRSIDAGISSVGFGPRVAVTTTSSCACCAMAASGASTSSSAGVPNLFASPMNARLHGMRKFFLLLLAFAVAAPAAAELDAALLKELRAGGLVLYMRHASTDFS